MLLKKALSCSHLNGETSSSNVNNSLNTIGNSLLNGMQKTSTDLNNNDDKNSIASNSIINLQQQQQLNNLTTTSNQQINKLFHKSTHSYYNSSPPPNLISTIQETDTELIKPIINQYPTRPPILKHQPKGNSLSSNSTTISSSLLTNNSSFDSNLSIENLNNFIRSDSIDKLTCDRILNERIANSGFKHNNSASLHTITSTHGGKIAKLSRNLTDHKISTPLLNKIHHKSIGQRSQSQDEMNYNNFTSSTSDKLNLDFKSIKQEQDLKRQLIIKQFEEQQSINQKTLQQQLEEYDKKCQAELKNLKQPKEFGNQIIEEENIHSSRLDEYKDNDNDNLNNNNNFKASSSSITNSNTNLIHNSGTTSSKPICDDTRKRLKDSIINKQKMIEQSGGLNQQPPSSIVNWAHRLKNSEDLIPLRKTASEPNLKVKSALKQKVMSKRGCSPLLKKRQKRFSKGMPMHLVGTDANAHSAPVSASSSMESNTPPNSKPESHPGSPPAFIGGSITTGNSASSTPQYNEPSSNLQNNQCPSPFNDCNPLYSSPSLPNISKHHPRFYPSTSPTLLHYQKLKQHFKQRLEKEAMNANIIGPTNNIIAANQTFINNSQFINSAAASFRSQRQFGSPLLSNSVDNSQHISSRDSPAAHSSSLKNKEQNFSPYTVNFKPLNKKLSRTQSAPLTFGLPLQHALANYNNVNNNNLNLTNQQQQQTTQSSSNNSLSHLVKQKMKQKILTSQKLNKKQSGSSSFEQQLSDKQILTNDKNAIDSGSGSFDENYNFNEFNKTDLQRQLIEQLQQQLNSSQQPQLTASAEDINNYHQFIMEYQQILQFQQQQQLDVANINQLNNQLNTNLTQLLSQAAAGNNQLNNMNYAKLLMNSQLQQMAAASGLKRALSTPMVMSPNSIYSNPSLFSSAAANLLAAQPSLTSLVGPFSGLNLSHTNLNSIVNQAELNSNLATGTTMSTIDQELNNYENRTAIITDESMLRHNCTCGISNNHLECPERIIEILKRLDCTNLLQKCVQLTAGKSSIEELETVHSSTYCQYFASEPLLRQKLESSPELLNELPIKSLVRMNCGGVGIDNDTIWNSDYTWQAVRAAAGCVTELACLVAKNKLKNGFAVVRPPGHHAEHQIPMGFCYFNSIAVAAKQLKLKHGLNRILILDFDVHHGNGTQKTFYDDDQVLYLSLHRHDSGNFFPGTGDASDTGASSKSYGKTINISWSDSANYSYGDAEYLAAFRTIVLPVIEEWKPEMILVSCGFDGAIGHPLQLGGYNLSPAMFGWMINEVAKLTNGRKIVLALEGGYSISSICDCSEQVVKALLGLKTTEISDEELSKRPNLAAVETLQKVFKYQGPYWKCLEKPNYYLIKCSHYEALVHLTKDKSAFTPRRISPISCKEEDEVEEPMES